MRCKGSQLHYLTKKEDYLPQDQGTHMVSVPGASRCALEIGSAEGSESGVRDVRLPSNTCGYVMVFEDRM